MRQRLFEICREEDGTFTWTDLFDDGSEGEGVFTSDPFPTIAAAAADLFKNL